MSDRFEAGGYRYLKAVFQYSSGVAAEPGFEIRRARFAKGLALEAGFAAIEAHLGTLGRPTAALCAVELRSPAPFTQEGFLAFNRIYVQTLERWGIYRDGVNPVARTNVCPVLDPPPAPCFHAFSYTVPTSAVGRGTFVTSGGGELADGQGSYRERIVCAGDVSPKALGEKLRFVMAEMERRVSALGFGWADARATRLYSARDLGEHLVPEILGRQALAGGLAWEFSRPPVVDIEARWMSGRRRRRS